MADNWEKETEDPIYEIEVGGYTFRAWYGKAKGSDSLIEISKGDTVIKRFFVLGYKVYNIAAHADDIAKTLEAADEGRGEIARAVSPIPY